jgi:outer membrane protein assembly factor BamB
MMNSRIIAVVSVAILWVGAPALVWAAGEGNEWPCWLGPNHDGKSPDRGLLKDWPPGGPKQLWKVSGIGWGHASVAVSEGKVFIIGEGQGGPKLSAFDREGKLLWKVACGRRHKDGCNASPAVDNGNVYTLDPYGLLTCHDADTGTKKWSREAKEFGGESPGWGYQESPLIHDHWVAFKPGGKNCIVAFDKASGREVWKSTGFSASPEFSSCTPFVHNQVPLLVTGTSGGLVCVNAKTGELLWRNGFSANNVANCPTPLYSDGYVFWANGYDKGGIAMKLEPDGSAKLAYKTYDMNCERGGYIIDNGYIYGNSRDGWMCLDLKTGKKMWFERGVGKGSLCWADGMLYLFGERSGRAALATCSPDGLKITGNLQVAGTGDSFAHPVVAGGCLYLRVGDNLYCFDVKSR